MTLAFDDRYIKYDPVVSTDTFIVPFPIYSADDLGVIVDGTEITAYSVTATFTDGVCEDAEIVLVTAVDDVSVEIYGNREPRAIGRYVGNSPNLASQLEIDVERLTAVQQELYRDMGRAAKVSLSSTVSPALEDPVVGAILIGTADGWVNGPTVDSLVTAPSSQNRFTTVAELLDYTGDALVIGSTVEVLRPYAAYAVVSSGEDVTTAGGDKLQVVASTVTPEMVAGSVGTGSNDTAAIKAALTARRRLGVPLTFVGQYYVTASTTADPIELVDGDVLIWADGATVTGGTYGVPIFWNQSEGDKITLVNPNIRTSYTMVTGKPALGTSFRTFLQAKPDMVAFPDRNQYFSLVFFGTDLKIEGQLTAGSDSASASGFMYGALAVGYGPNLHNCKLVMGDSFFDGTCWGILAWCYDICSAGIIKSKRYTFQDPTTHTDEQPSHVVYCTAQGSAVSGYDPILTTDFESIVDFAEYVAFDGSMSGIANNTAKFTQPYGSLRVGSVWSKRLTGCLDVGGAPAGDVTDARIRPVSIGPVFWDGSAGAVAYYNTNKAVRLGIEPSSGTFIDTHGIADAKIGPITLLLADDDATYCSMVGDNIDVEFNIIYRGVARSTTPFLLCSINNSRVKVRLSADAAAQSISNWLFARLDNAGSNNRFEIETDAPEWLTVRFVENDKAATDNAARVLHTPTGGTREIGQGFQRTRRFVNEEVDLTGASVTVSTNMPRKGDTILGVQTQIVTAITGATGFKVGIGSDDDMYGSYTGTAVGGGVEDNDWTADGSGWMLANRDIVITALTSNFTAGRARISVQYETGARHSDTI